MDLIKAMLGMLGKVSENLSGCLFTIGISLHKGMGGGGGRGQSLSQPEAGGFMSVCQPTL